ncbi:MAG: methionyl-tRNA formyltransferase [Lentisphaerae bacterium]|nr:methionyl-tRNA formyltransferase [Lentisphaerota bacterium]
MRLIFMGSASFSCPSLDALMRCDGIEVVGVITQPDRPKGRRRVVSPCAVKDHLSGSDVAIMTPDDVNSKASIAAIAELRPNLIVVVAYGQILKKAVLDVPDRGCVNLHASLLPKYRGAAPIQWAITNGESRTGVTVMLMNERMDEGDIILKREVDIGYSTTGGELQDRLSIVGASALVEAVGMFANGAVTTERQDSLEASLAPKLNKEDGRIVWTDGARAIYNKVRAFNPWPCCFCKYVDGSGTVLRIWRVEESTGEGMPGEIIGISDDGPLVAVGDGAIRLLEVQPEGRKRMTGSSYVCGYRLRVGQVFQ